MMFGDHEKTRTLNIFKASQNMYIFAVYLILTFGQGV